MTAILLLARRANPGDWLRVVSADGVAMAYFYAPRKGLSSTQLT